MIAEKIRLLLSYLHYYFHSKTKYDVHSPFVYAFITEVLEDNKKYDGYAALRQLSHWAKKNNQLIWREDYGAGTKMSHNQPMKVSQIFRNTAISPKYQRLLFRISRWHKPQTCIELGTGLGMATAALALGNKTSVIYTIEGDPNIAHVAQQHFNALQLYNVHLITGKFDEQLPRWLAQHPQIDLAFIDGNHQYQQTVNYYRMLAPHCHNNSMIIFDDIRWSAGMFHAWKEIISDKSVTLSFDLYRLGIVFFRKENKAKEHYLLYF
jgi:predicted O-methyltransferase YrrM